VCVDRKLAPVAVVYLPPELLQSLSAAPVLSGGDVRPSFLGLSKLAALQRFWP